MYCVVTTSSWGKPRNVYGPFESRQDAIRWAEKNLAGQIYRVMPMGGTK